MDNEQEIRDLLEDELRSELKKLSQMTPGEKAHSEAVDSIVKLYKLKVDETEKEREFMRKSDESTNQTLELKLKETQLREAAKDRYFRFGADLAKAMVPAAVFALVTFTGYKLEYVDRGMVSSPTLKGILGKIRPN